jgi:hypothetical protein
MSIFATFDPIADLMALFDLMFRRHHKRGRR